MFKEILIFILFIIFTANQSFSLKGKINEWSRESTGFEKNIGQIKDFNGNPSSKPFFRLKLNEFSIFITNKGATFSLYKIERKEEKRFVKYASFDLELLNSRIEEDKIEYEDEIGGYTNYYIPQAPEGILFVKNYKKVRIKDVYPGVDWVFKLDEGKLHHEFVLMPFADIKKIKMKVKGADLEIYDEGKKMKFKTSLGEIEDGKIYAYEGKKSIETFYKRNRDGTIGFDVKNYSKKAPLVIDPPLSLVWATYLGGSTCGEMYGTLCTDGEGNIILAGLTSSYDFPTYNPGGGAYYQETLAAENQEDLYIIKFDNNGVRKWATYYGGSKEDIPNDIVADKEGNIFIVGATESSDFPVYDPGGGAYFQGTFASKYYNAFILKFSKNGIREWATYYGGSFSDSAGGIAVDNEGNVFIVGGTLSSDFPTYNPGGGAYFQDKVLTGSLNDDVFILKFSNNGIRNWATCYGGDEDEGASYIAVDNEGNIFVAGSTDSVNLPLYNPGGDTYFQETRWPYGFDIFILKFNNDGIRKWATYYGGYGGDGVGGITVDEEANIFITGDTYSDDFPTYNPGGEAYFQETNAGESDAFILKFTNSGKREWATFYGGTFDDSGNGITTDKEGNVYVTGKTISQDFPTYNLGGGAYFKEKMDEEDYLGDGFILMFTNSGKRKWATLYGGKKSSYFKGTGDGFGDCVTDKYGNLFVRGSSDSFDFPTKNPGGGAYFQPEAGHHIVLKFESASDLQEELFEQIIPAVANTEGLMSSFWKTDLQILNPDETSQNYTIIFIPAGTDGTQTNYKIEGAIEQFQLLIFEDILKNFFGLENTFGCLHIKSEKTLIATSRTYTKDSKGGSFGQFIKGYKKSEALKKGETGYITYISSKEGYRTNLGFVEVSGKEAVVEINIHDLEGKILHVGPITRALKPMGFIQINDISSFYNYDYEKYYGPASAEIKVYGEGAVFAYSSVIDNRTNDAVFVPLMKEFLYNANQSFAVSIKKEGDKGTLWKTDLEIFNSSIYSQELTFEFYDERDYKENRFIKGKGILSLSDAISEIFNLSENSGKLKIKAYPGVFAILRIYTTSKEGGTFGQFVPSSLIHSPVSLNLNQYILNLSSNERFRTNLGLTVLPYSCPSTVEVSLYNKDGIELGKEIFELLEEENKQINNIFDYFNAGNVDYGYARVRVLSGGSVLAYASVVDNITGDAIYIPGQ